MRQYHHASVNPHEEQHHVHFQPHMLDTVAEKDELNTASDESSSTDEMSFGYGQRNANAHFGVSTNSSKKTAPGLQSYQDAISPYAVYNELLGPGAFADQMIDIDFAAIEISNLTTALPDGLIVRNAYVSPDQASFTHFGNTVFPQLQYYRGGQAIQGGSTNQPQFEQSDFCPDSYNNAVNMAELNYEQGDTQFVHYENLKPTAKQISGANISTSTFTRNPQNNQLREIACDVDIDDVLRKSGTLEYVKQQVF